MTTIPTESLTILYTDLGFLAAAMENQKPCFKGRYYVDKNSWIGSLYRLKDVEGQDVSGISNMVSICRRANEHYSSLNEGDNYGEILLEKIIDARKGLERIARTYESLGKTISSENIKNQAILLLDSALPNDVKIREGFKIAPRIQVKKSKNMIQYQSLNEEICKDLDQPALMKSEETIDQLTDEISEVSL